MNKRCLHLAAILSLGLGVSASAAEPLLKWAYEAQSNLYAPPLAAEMHPEPGLETVISDSEARVLRCIDARGRQLWAYEGGWKKRLTSSAALGPGAGGKSMLLAICGSDGRLCCIDAATGAEQWTFAAGPITWGGVLWADLEGDGSAELVAGTEGGIVALDAAGRVRWSFHGEKDRWKLGLRGHLAVADVDGDGALEIFGADTWGPFSVGSDGVLRWRRPQPGGHDFCSSVVLGDANRDGRAELYCASWNDNALWAFDADTGDLRWQCPLLGGADVYPSASIPIADLDGDGLAEIIATDREGHVHAVSHTGCVQWVFSTDMRTHAAATVGDVDGDEELEILVASGDHGLYCLDRHGTLEWKFQTGLRLMYPPTITDVDADGKTDILFCGSDHILRCVTLDGRYRPALMPWPSCRFDSAQRGCALGFALPKEDAIHETRSLFLYGGFEEGKLTQGADTYPQGSALYETRRALPRGWQADAGNEGTWTLDRETAHGGGASLRVAGHTVVTSAPIELPPRLQRVNAGIFAKGISNVKPSLRWIGATGLLRRDLLDAAGEENGWTRFAADGLAPPRAARWVSLVCLSDGEGWWDSAHLEGVIRAPRNVQVLVNQVGYDVAAPKRFSVQANFAAEKARFSLIRDDSQDVFSGKLTHHGRIRGHYGKDWGHEYWRGDFTAFDESGRYRIQVTLDSVSEVSWPFEIGADCLWRRTVWPAYRFFYYQRCGMAIPGYHGACHLDDAVSPDGREQYECWGGWHDAGDYNTYHNAPYVYGLARAYGIQKVLFDRQDADGNGRSDFLDEILWGGDHARRMIAPDGSARGHISSGYGYWGPPELETDNLPKTGDERRMSKADGDNPDFHQAAMARIARYVDDNAPWIDAAERSLKWALENNRRGLLQFSTALDLFIATGKPEHAAQARDLFPEITASVEVADTVRRYDEAFAEDHSAALAEAFVTKTEAMLPLADNPFGVYTFGPADAPNFFGTPDGQPGWHVGTSSHLLGAASLAALAYTYTPDPRFLAFVYDQLNWTLGTNPFNISLMEGQGSAFPPTYHHRYTFSGVRRGAVPGSVVNGITWSAPGDDRPYFDMSGADIPAFESNEVWLPHNTHYLNALVNLKSVAPRGMKE